MRNTTNSPILFKYEEDDSPETPLEAALAQLNAPHIAAGFMRTCAQWLDERDALSEEENSQTIKNLVAHHDNFHERVRNEIAKSHKEVWDKILKIAEKESQVDCKLR